MGIAVIPAPSAGGGIKLVQRGQAVSGGNITITAVDTSKAFVNSFSEGSSGTVATNSTVAAFNGSVPQHDLIPYYGSNNAQMGNNPYGGSVITGKIAAHTISNASASISGGTMNATTKQMGAYLSNSTTLVATGACRWEVVEFA